MIKVKLQLADDKSALGEAEFVTIPRVGEEIYVPSKGSEGELRIFTVDEVFHFARGLGGNSQFPAYVMLSCVEIT